MDSGDEVQEIHGIDVGSLAQIRGRIDARRLDVALDLLGHRGQPVHVQNLPADFLLVFRDVDVRIDLLGPEVVHDLHGPLAEDVALEDVGERRLRVHREHQHLLALARDIRIAGYYWSPEFLAAELPSIGLDRRSRISMRRRSLPSPPPPSVILSRVSISCAPESGRML